MLTYQERPLRSPKNRPKRPIYGGLSVEGCLMAKNDKKKTHRGGSMAEALRQIRGELDVRLCAAIPGRLLLSSAAYVSQRWQIY